VAASGRGEGLSSKRRFTLLEALAPAKLAASECALICGWRPSRQLLCGQSFQSVVQGQRPAPRPTANAADGLESEFRLSKRFSVAMKVLDQIRRAGLWVRYWSLLIAIALPILGFFFLDFQSSRILVSIISASLLMHAWRMQMRGSHSIWRSMLWTSVLLLPIPDLRVLPSQQALNVPPHLTRAARFWLI